MFLKKTKNELKNNLTPEKIYGIAPGPGDTKLEVVKKPVVSEEHRGKDLLKHWEQKTNCEIATKFVCPSCGEVCDNDEIIGSHVYINGHDKAESNLKIVPICKNCNEKFRLRPFDVVRKYVVSDEQPLH